ncbi:MULTISPECIES: hypothetical protein [unclassified Actinopolyspora]|uniref:hypothetical protein n=1 Tax=unclassified Actinopolyspora TaxID=2639451 RepID=UPI0013F6497F|nr:MULTISPECIES: hypothetical protein [unclassified Actinopolyspora]NHD16755.1 hypothetical protein [Actinopolyspora sp. BKK2]NHE75382.1 hypothetical protein [Actinopolyspora sp. BKK1]
MREETESTTNLFREDASSEPGNSSPVESGGDSGSDSGGESGGKRAPWGGNRTVAAVLIACGLAVAGGVAVYAATSGGSGGSGAMGGGPGGGFQAPGGRSGGTGGASALSDALHGEFTVRTEQGEYATRKLQTGDVTAVGSESLTVESEDGYSRKYTVDTSTVVDGGDSTIDDLSSGETVTVVATPSGDSATASTVTSEQASGAPGGVPGQGGGATGQGGVPGQGGGSAGSGSGADTASGND